MIPECDRNNDTKHFIQPWLEDAIPYKNNRPEKCARFNDSHEIIFPSDQCPKSLFNQSVIVGCNNTFIFKTNEHRIIKEVIKNVNLKKSKMIVCKQIESIAFSQIKSIEL